MVTRNSAVELIAAKGLKSAPQAGGGVNAADLIAGSDGAPRYTLCTVEEKVADEAKKRAEAEGDGRLT